MTSEDAPTVQAELAVDAGMELGECPIWVERTGRLHWVDISGCRLHFLEVSSGRHHTLEFSEKLGAIAEARDGRLLVAFAKRLVYLDADSGDVEEICAVEPERPGNRCNDGKFDPAGRFWVGTLQDAGARAGTGSLFRLDGDRMTRVLSDLTIPNGLAWSADARTMYYIDSPQREVWAFDFDVSDSAIANRRTVVRVPEELGVPDGMALGSEGTLWVANWGSGSVCEWDPVSGRMLRKVLTGCPATTSCCFGPGGDLYITTARDGSGVGGGLYRLRND